MNGSTLQGKTDCSMNYLRKIPPYVWSIRLHWARIRAIYLLWMKVFFSDLQQNFVFSGILIILMRILYEKSSLQSDFYVLIISILILPFVKISFFMEKRQRLSLYVEQFRKYKEVGFGYLLYHGSWVGNFAVRYFAMIRAVNKKIDDIEKNSSLDMYKKLNKYEDEIRRIQKNINANLQDFDARTVLINFHLLYGFRSIDSLYHFLRFHPNQVKAELFVYIDRSLRVVNAIRSEDLDLEKIEELVKLRRNFRSRFQNRKKDLEILKNISVVRAAREIVVERSTSGSIVLLKRTLEYFIRRGFYYRFNARYPLWKRSFLSQFVVFETLEGVFNVRTVKKCRSLVELVRHARGSDLVALAGIEKWYDDIQRKVEPEIETLWSGGFTHQNLDRRLVENVEKFIKNISDVTLRQHGIDFTDGDIKLNFATSGHSETVAEVLSQLRSIVKQVYVIQVGEGMEEENANFRAFLLSNELDDCRLIRSQTLEQDHFRSRIDCLLIGFEMVDSSGNMLHPRGVSDAIDQALVPGIDGHKPVVIAVGTSNKKHEFEEAKVDPEIVSLYSPRIVDGIVTEEGVYIKNREGRFNLSDQPNWPHSEGQSLI